MGTIIGIAFYKNKGKDLGYRFIDVSKVKYIEKEGKSIWYGCIVYWLTEKSFDKLYKHLRNFDFPIIEV